MSEDKPLAGAQPAPPVSPREQRTSTRWTLADWVVLNIGIVLILGTWALFAFDIINWVGVIVLAFVITTVQTLLIRRFGVALRRS